MTANLHWTAVTHSPTDTDTPTPEEARATALGLLARREHSALELRHKLSQRGCTPDIVATVTAQLAAEGLLDDARYADVYAHARVDKGYGPLRIQRELRERGVSEDIVTDLLAQLDEVWADQINKVQRKKFRTPPRDFADKGKQTLFLRHRGFTLEQIQRLFREYQP